MYDLFISYSTKGGLALAKSLANSLEKDLWKSVYVADKEIIGGILNEQIRNAISQSKRVLIIFTPDAVDSDWVLGEAELAREMGKEIVILRRTDVPQTALPIPLQKITSIVFNDESDLYISIIKLDWGIPVIIPCAGKASGLYPFNVGMPKILFPVGERPILHHIVDKLEPKLFSKVILLTGYFSKMVEYYASLLNTDIPIECVTTTSEKLPLALKNMNIKTTFMLYFSDIILEGDVNWAGFIKRHERDKQDQGVIGTLMTSKKHKLLVGRVETDGQDPHLISGFAEKPDNSMGYSINMAVSIFEPEFLSLVREDDKSLFGDTFTHAMKDNYRFSHYAHDNWLHIQTLNDWYVVQTAYFGERSEW